MIYYRIQLVGYHSKGFEWTEQLLCTSYFDGRFLYQDVYKTSEFWQNEKILEGKTVYVSLNWIKLNE